MKRYTTYEEAHKYETFTLEEMQTLYKEEVNKSEYPNFETWLYDMLKSGVFEEV